MTIKKDEKKDEAAQIKETTVYLFHTDEKGDLVSDEFTLEEFRIYHLNGLEEMKELCLNEDEKLPSSFNSQDFQSAYNVLIRILDGLFNSYSKRQQEEAAIQTAKDARKKPE